MKAGLILGAALCLLAATADARPLDAANLRLAAASLSRDFDYLAWARARIRRQEPATWALLQDDPGAMRAAVRARAAVLRDKVNGFDSKQPFVVGKVIRVRSYDPQLGGFAIAPALKSSVFAVRNFDHIDGSPMPNAFVLLSSNFDQLSLWPATSGEKAPRRVYVESEVRLVAYQHHRYFQAVVLKTTIYPSMRKQRILFEQLETRPAEQVIKESLLADGISLNRVPIHSFWVFGERLLEPLFEREMRSSDCQALAPLKGHRQWRCSADWPVAGIGLSIERLYVGGRLVELKFFGQKRVDSEALSTIRLQIRQDVSLPDDADTSQPTTWHKHATEFRFDPQALVDPGSGRAFLRVRPDAFFKTELKPVP